MGDTINIDIERYNGSDFDILLPTPSQHASSHASGGSDVLTPAAIGAKPSGIEPISTGGTGASNASAARSNLGITPTNIGAKAVDSIEDISHGGTGATTAEGARTNLGAIGTSGGNFTGNVSFGQQATFNGRIILNASTYGNSLPPTSEATQGRLFFKKVTQ